MLAIYSLLLIPLWAFLNRFRGAPAYIKTNKTFIGWYLNQKPEAFDAKLWAYVGMFITLLPFTISTNYLLSPILFVAIWISFTFGWGKYFPHGQPIIYRVNAPPINVYAEKEIFWIDAICDKVYGKLRPDTGYTLMRKYQTLGMCLRFSIIGFLLFVPLAIITFNPLYLIGVLLTPASGLVYNYYFRLHANPNIPENTKHKNEGIAEYVVGAYLGFIIFLINLLDIYV